jgi:hypothetical protein
MDSAALVAARKRWSRDRRGKTTQRRFQRNKRLAAKASYILGHQPKSFDWRAREAKPHPWKRIPEDVFTLACETLNQIITIGN